MADTLIALIAQYAAILLSTIAIFLSLRAEYRNQRRFETQLKRNEELARRNALPILHATQIDYENEKGLQITNHGPGIAVVKAINCKLGAQEARDLVDIVDVGGNFHWDDFEELPDEFYIMPRESKVLLLLSFEGLREQKVSVKKARTILEALGEQLDETVVRVTYSNTFGNLIARNKRIHP